MATFTSAGAVAARARDIGRKLELVPKNTVGNAAQTVADRIEASAAGLRIPRARPRKLRSRVEVSGSSARISPVGGIWKWVEEGTHGHLITSKRGRGSRRSRATAWAGGGSLGGGRSAVLNIPGVGPRRFAHHPGGRAAAPGTYERGARVGVNQAQRLFDVEVKHALGG